MREAKKHFLDIFRIELDDLEEDINDLIERCHENYQHGVLTERVHMENVTLFQNELSGIRSFRKTVERTRYDGFDVLDDLIDFLVSTFRREARIKDIAPALLVCIDRKLNKVKKYVTQTPPVSGNCRKVQGIIRS